MINDIIDRALELEGAAREAYLEEACGGDIALREKVNQLIGVMSVDVPAAFMQDPLPVPEFTDIEDVFASRGSHIQAGQRIGVYRIVEQIGFGGMGEVYLAERDDGEFEQRVAIKVVKAGMGTDEVLRRFHYERQILANLEHPNIARLLFGGISDEGQPYFVMEYVEGESITEYCDRKRLSVRERLKLFKTVCDAVRHAQRNLVVHRDLKPGNILVTDDGVVKLLDFGIAKLLEADSDPITAFHTTGRLGPFTPAYAAPEQVLGKPINAGTDVYALGVILYELLTGRRPYQLERGGGLLPENVRLICEKVPTVPSSVATRRHLNEEAAVPYELSEKRGVEPVRLKRTLQGDLDAIVMKALKKEPERRYASAGELSVDLDSYLANKPVSAQNDSWRYRGFKFVQRHKVPVGAIAVAVLALSLGLVTALRSSAIAKREAAVSNSTLSLLLGIFEDINPEKAQKSLIDPKDLIAAGVERVNVLSHEPLIQAEALSNLGRVSLSVGMIQQADSLFSASENLRKENSGRKSLITAQSLYWRGESLRILRDFAESEDYLRNALSIRRRLLRDDNIEIIETLNALANSLYTQKINGNAEKGYEAQNLLEEAVVIGEQYFPTNLELVKSYKGLADLYVSDSMYARGQDFYYKAINLLNEDGKESAVHLAEVLFSLAECMEDIGDYKSALKYHREAMEVKKGIYGESRKVAESKYEIAALLHREGDIYDASSLYFEVIKDFDRFLPETHSWRVYPRIRLARIFVKSEDYTKAEDILIEALRISVECVPLDSTVVKTNIELLANIYHVQGKTAEEEDLRWTFKKYL